MIFFRFPGGEKFYTVRGKVREAPISFISFNEKQRADFFGEISEILPNEIRQVATSELPESANILNESQPKYERRISDAVTFIKDNSLEKLVISRRKIISLNGQVVDLTQTFLNISKAFPNAFSYLMQSGNYCMVGAFSELLGKFDKKKSEFSTMSLAGTLPAEETWTEKEIKEQKPVTEYIKNILTKYSEDVEVSETYDHFSGKIKHLRNDFTAKINPENLENLIQELHPTPAVCGIPKEFCKKAIQQSEDFPRNFYAGYIRAETADFTNYFVNLRCAEFYKNQAILYAGGGITAESAPEKEWRETELKADAVLKNLAYL